MYNINLIPKDNTSKEETNLGTYPDNDQFTEVLTLCSVLLVGLASGGVNIVGKLSKMVDEIFSDSRLRDSIHKLTVHNDLKASRKFRNCFKEILLKNSNGKVEGTGGNVDAGTKLLESHREIIDTTINKDSDYENQCYDFSFLVTVIGGGTGTGGVLELQEIINKVDTIPIVFFSINQRSKHKEE